MALLPGYPQPIGAKTEVVANIAGPGSYAAIVVATPPTGGQLINASDIGLKYIDHVHCSLSDNGQYETLPTRGDSASQAVPSIRLMWRVAATGVECTPGTVLSGRAVRLRVVGIG
jgi:hypothetical protein